MNKYYKKMRDNYNSMHKGVTIDSELLRICKDQTVVDKVKFASTTNVLEPFVVSAIADVLCGNQSYLIAENALGDKIVEIASSITVSIKKNSNIGLFSFFAIGNNTQNSSRQAILYAYIASELLKRPDFINLDNSVKKEFESDNDVVQIASFIQDIRDSLYNAKTEDLISATGDVYPLDVSSGLPHVQNLTAALSIINGTVDYPKGNQFKNTFVADSGKENVVARKYSNIDSFNVTPDREFSIDEEELIAENEERTAKYVLTPRAKDILTDYFDLHSLGEQPISMAFYGPSGAGKTVMAQVIARELHRPYVHYKIQENTDEDTLKGKIKSIQGKDTGEVEYKDSAIVEALKNGWVCEVQELSTCTNQGAETFFNPILDKTRCFEDASGNLVKIHPDALIIFTYNPDYCENNQVATSLLNRIEESYRCEFPDIETCCKIFKNETGFTDLDVLRKIYNICFGDGTEIASISNMIEDEDLEEELSIRQVCNWIKRYMSCRRYNGQEQGWAKAAVPTIVNTIGIREQEVQESILDLIKSAFA